MTALTNELLVSSGSSSRLPLPPAPLTKARDEACGRRRLRRSVRAGVAGAAGRDPRRTAASPVRSQACGLCLVVFRGLLPASAELFFLCQVFLGSASPVLSLSLLVPKWWRH